MAASSAPSSKPMKIGVIGPAGFGGSYLCVELLRRGHHVVGISRKPETVGSHPRYEVRPADFDALSVEGIAGTFSGLEVLISQYGPHTGGADALQYMPFIEVVRKLILAVKFAKVPYFIMVGGAGSLHLPAQPYGECVSDSPHWWLAYRRGIADSEAHTAYMEERLGPLGTGLRKYRDGRLAARRGASTAETQRAVDEYEAALRQNDRASDFIKGARTSFMFFDGNQSFRWTYASPSPLYRPGKRTGEYKVSIDYVPLKEIAPKENPLEDRLTGITASDFCIALADEAESQQLAFKHWTAIGDLSDDTPFPSYVTLDELKTMK